MIGLSMASLSTPSGPRVAVLTVSYGSHDVLSSFLSSLPSAASAPVLTIVADNKPELDGAVRALANRHGAQYLPLESNRGYGGAINVAASSLDSTIEWLLVSNPDVTLGPGSIDALVSVGEDDLAIGAVGPVILTSEGTVYPSARAVPSLRTGIGHAIFVNAWPSNPWTRRYRDEQSQSPSRRDVGWLSGACLLVRRSVFDELGGFDDGYFMYFEDVDLGYRIGRAGFRNVYVPAAVVTHTGAHATAADSERMVRAHHDSARRFLNRKYARRVLWPVRASLSVGLRARSWLVRRRLDQ
jgi:N-acetylglucosaminyl-diphospho-decaprenol L-rhamnosyltransferase